MVARLSARALVDDLPTRVGAPPRDQRFEGAVQIEVTGGAAPFIAHVAFEPSGAPKVHAGAATNPVASMTSSEKDFVELCYGDSHVFNLIETGRLQIQGPMPFLEKLYWMLLVARPEIVEELAQVAEMSANRPRLRAIERVQGTDRDIRAAALDSRPVVLVGLVNGWPPATWSLDDLARRFAEITIVAKGESIRLADHVARMRSMPEHENVTTGAYTMPKEMFEHVGPPPFVRTSAVDGLPEMFVSARGASTKLHRDMSDGVLVNLFGRRRFRMYSPDQDALVYPNPNFTGFQECRVDPDEPNLADYPRFAESEPLDFVVEPGEVLFVPFGWFHHVNVVEHSCGVRFNLNADWAMSYAPL